MSLQMNCELFKVETTVEAEVEPNAKPAKKATAAEVAIVLVELAIVLGLVAGVIFLIPAATIWTINALLGAAIPVTLRTWFGAFALLLLMDIAFGVKRAD